MASRNLTRLNVALTATIGPFASAFKGATGIAERFGSSLKSALLSPIGLITSALSAGAFVAGIKNAATRIDALAKSADRLGISTQSFAGLQHAAELSGASAEELRGGMEKLTRKVEEAAQGNRAAQQSFASMGLSVKDLVGLSPDEQFKKVADSINNLGTQGQKTAAVMDVFGKSGGSLLNTLALGSDGLNKMTTEAEKLGIAVSRVDAAKVEEANDAMTKVHEVFQGIFDKIAVKLAPFVTAIADAFTGAAIEANGFGSTIDNVMNFAVKAGAFVANAWQGLTIVWNALMVGAGWVGATITNMGDTAIRIAEWIGTKFIQAWTVIKSNAALMGNALGVVWAETQIPVAQFVQFVGTQLAHMLQNMADAVRRLTPEMADSLDAAAGSIASSTGDSVARAEKNLSSWKRSTSDALEADKQAWIALFSDVETTGSDTLQRMTVAQIQFANEHQQAIQDIAAQGPAGDNFQALVAQVQAEAQVKAEARAAEVAATQQQQRDLGDAEAQGSENRWVSWSYWRDQMSANDYKFTKDALSGTSSMFANLEKFQDLHNKKARAVGKAAAKAKIVTDTASAAMGAYSAMASIPFIGPVLGIAAAAAAMAAGAIQLSNVDKGDAGSRGAMPADSSTTNIGGIAAPNTPGQTLVLQGDSFSAESLVKLFSEAKERGIVIEGVRRG